MTREHFDVVIAGAGLAGLALAPALARCGLAVALVDRGTLALPDDEATTFDSRVYAVSPGSASFLRAQGAWQRLPSERVTAIEAMQVVGDRGTPLGFSAYELGERALAWIVEERTLRAALLPLVHEAGVAIVTEALFGALDWSAQEAILKLQDGRELSAALVVGADGVRSWVRHAAGMVAEPRSYGQTAVVANFATERAHFGVAHQWFMPDGGVLAWLPLPGRNISIVWSAPDALAQVLSSLSPEDLADRVGKAGNDALGTLTSVTPSVTFPLSFLQLKKTIAHRLVLVGDAAHGVHPLAGQGANLGFGDVAALAQIIAERGPVRDVGATVLLERYARRRHEPVLAMQAVTDGLVKLFGPSLSWMRYPRNAGLAALDRMPTLKRLLASPALR